MPETPQTLEDLLLDDLFVRWVVHPTPTLDRHWQDWQAQQAHRSELMARARRIVLEARTAGQQGQLDDQEVETLWNELQSRHHGRRRPSVLRSPKLWWPVAASLALLTLLGVLWYSQTQTYQGEMYQTAYGETQTFMLPDSTTVILNANSTLTLDDRWLEQTDRRVTLEGEAYFNVKHTSDHRRFLVQTNSVVVEVLGTSFNVQQRRDRAQVVLSEGRVSLHSRNPGEPASITMQPGDLVEMTSASYTQSRVDVEAYTAWTRDELVFDGTTVGEIARLLEDNYGLQVQIRDSTLAHKKFRGRIASDDIESLFGQLEKVFQCTIQQQGKEVVFLSRNQ